MLTHDPRSHRRTRTSFLGAATCHVPWRRGHSQTPPGPLRAGAPVGAREERSDDRALIRDIGSSPATAAPPSAALGRPSCGLAGPDRRPSGAARPVHLKSREEPDHARKTGGSEYLSHPCRSASMTGRRVSASSAASALLRFAAPLRVTPRAAPPSLPPRWLGVKEDQHHEHL